MIKPILFTLLISQSLFAASPSPSPSPVIKINHVHPLVVCESWNYKPATCDTGVKDAQVWLDQANVEKGSETLCTASNWSTSVAPATGNTVINATNGCRAHFSYAPDYFLPQDASGWSILPAASDSVFYADSINGLDTNSGITPDKPVKTLNRLQSLMSKRAANSSAHAYLKRGSTWNENFSVMAGGPSPSNPVIVDGWNYGLSTDPRPVLSNLQTWGGSNIVAVGLYFKGVGGYVAVNLRGTQKVIPRNLLMEDCVVDGFFQNINAGSGLLAMPMVNFIMRRSQSINAWDPGFAKQDESKPQGIYVSGTNGILFEGDLFDHNGYSKPDYSDGSMFGHDLYFSTYAPAGNENVWIRNTIIGNGLHSIKGPQSGNLVDNLFYNNGVTGYWGASGYSKIQGNVFYKNDVRTVAGFHLSNPTGVIVQSGGMGFSNYSDMTPVIASGNYFIHGHSTAFGYSPYSANITIMGNTIYDWEQGFGSWTGAQTVVISNNLIQSVKDAYKFQNSPLGHATFSGNVYDLSDAKPFIMKYATPLSYADYVAQFGETGSSQTKVVFNNPTYVLDYPTLLAKVKSQSKYSWDPNASAAWAISQVKGAFAHK